MQQDGSSIWAQGSLQCLLVIAHCRHPEWAVWMQESEDRGSQLSN